MSIYTGSSISPTRRHITVDITTNWQPRPHILTLNFREAQELVDTWRTNDTNPAYIGVFAIDNTRDTIYAWDRDLDHLIPLDTLDSERLIKDLEDLLDQVRTTA